MLDSPRSGEARIRRGASNENLSTFDQRFQPRLSSELGLTYPPQLRIRPAAGGRQPLKGPILFRPTVHHANARTHHDTCVSGRQNPNDTDQNSRLVHLCLRLGVTTKKPFPDGTLDQFPVTHFTCGMKDAQLMLLNFRSSHSSVKRHTTAAHTGQYVQSSVSFRWLNAIVCGFTSSGSRYRSSSR